jgi:hypothetical protein
MSVYASETLTYGEIVGRVNEMFTLLDAEKARQDKREPRAAVRATPPAPYADWSVTFRADPHYKITDALFEVQVIPRIQVMGMWAARDRGERAAALVLDGYYTAVSRVIEAVPQAGVKRGLKPAAWREMLESDAPEADQLDDLIATLGLYWSYKRQIAEKKLAPPSTSGPIGEPSV